MLSPPYANGLIGPPLPLTREEETPGGFGIRAFSRLAAAGIITTAVVSRDGEARCPARADLSVRKHISYRPLAAADRFYQHHTDHQEPAKHSKLLSHVRQVASPYEHLAHRDILVCEGQRVGEQLKCAREGMDVRHWGLPGAGLEFRGARQGVGKGTRDACFPAGFNSSYIIGRREARLSHFPLSLIRSASNGRTVMSASELEAMRQWRGRDTGR